MYKMILDTSSQVLYIAFVFCGDNDEYKIIYESISEGKNNHSDNLLKKIEEGLNLNNLKVKDFSEIIVGMGPGMYTGLRVSMTVAKMFAWTLNIKLLTLSSIDLLFSSYLDKDGIYACMLKAKKDYSYTKIFNVNSCKQEILNEEKFISNNEFSSILEGFDNYSLLNNEKININPINICKHKELLKPVSNIHALEPNYLREDVL